MKFLPVLAIFFASVLATPPGYGGGGGSSSNFDACPGALYSQTQCCSAGVGDIVDVDCSNPTITLTSINNFKANCASIGKRARCCTIPILGLSVLCQSPDSA
ncbi:hydrophobin [Fusarium langsethiae]|uniref:Hydrophobin n=1 Tax=Fusarium langsethiae TaxID=179993 RepID=A0A0N0DBP6_FUSLA|nr:hydrophobin [Fusarium langsethiae]